MSNLYTRTGDKGSSKLYNGEKRSKMDPIFNALGKLDELCVLLGRVRFVIDQYIIIEFNGHIIQIQKWLYSLMASIATPRQNSSDKKCIETHFDQSAVNELEEWIDQLQSKLPKITGFIIPYGYPCSHSINMARITCRQAELILVSIKENGEILEDSILPFINRLSSYLYACMVITLQRESDKNIQFFVNPNKK